MLLFVFGLSWAVTIPLVFAACTISGTLGIVYGVASVWATPTYATNLVQLIGLGIAVDYSLLIVYRFREEVALGKGKDDAIVRTMETAGRAVVFSGIAVALGLALLVAIPVPFIRMLGVAGFLIPIVSIIGAVTLQPALLSYYGRRGTVRRRVMPGKPSGPGARILGRSREHDHASAARLPAGGNGGARRDGDPGVLDPAHARLDVRDPADVRLGARLRPAADGGGRRSGRAGPDPRRGEVRLGALTGDDGCRRAPRRLARAGSRGGEGLRGARPALRRPEPPLPAGARRRPPRLRLPAGAGAREADAFGPDSRSGLPGDGAGARRRRARARGSTSCTRPTRTSCR